MSSPMPEQRSDRGLVWASDEVMAGIAQQIQPQMRQPTRNVVTRTAMLAFVVTWPAAFIVFAVATLVVPSVTDGASVAAAAFWALQVATLIAISTIVTALAGQRAARPGPADGAPSTGRAVLRGVGHALLTGACAGLVLALQGLSAGQIAALTGALVAVLHLLPLVATRLLLRSRQRRRAGSPAPAR
ncbi:hypothetical protein ACN27F_21220 [Solwaraspora sp. WMMB335]|uniref:hypothetical protein n=1 Tax=Solwaraspora sp. WMMB335 TaxID=3404118 RepID=UPI003B963C10